MPSELPAAPRPDRTAAPQSTVEGDWWARSDSAAVTRLHTAGVGLAARLLPVSRRDGAVRRWRLLLHRGDAVECNVCGSRFRHFMARWNADNVICWRCGSEERHRTLWLLLDRQRPELLAGTRSLLHFAPEPGLETLLRDRIERYVSSDIAADLGELSLDLTALDLPDTSFEATICSHVLEHIPDDAAAMRELHRVLVPGGWAIVMVPIDHALPATLEVSPDAGPEERRALAWQEDHVRLYGLDVADRLRGAGFEVEHVRPADQVSPAESARMRLGLGNDVFICRRRTSGSPGAADAPGAT